MKTKQLKSLLFALFGLCLGMMSCTPDDQQDPKATLSVDPPTLTFAITGETKEVIITTNQETWSAVCVPEADSEWCKIEKADGKLKITIGANSTEKDGRETVVKVTAGVGDNVATEEITVIQGAPAATLTVEHDALSFTAAGETKEVVITTNQDAWSAACVPATDAEWCILTQESGKLIVKVSENTSITSGRNTTIKVSAGTGLNVANADIAITQAKDEERTYALGDLYDKGGVKGIVIFLEGTPPGKYEPVREGTHGLIVSLDRYRGDWDANNVSSSVACSNREDGMVNTNEVKGQSNWKANFPAVAWCDALNKDGVTGWYMPAINELAVLYTCYDEYVGREAFDAALIAAGGVLIDPGVEEGDYRDPPNYKRYGEHYSSTFKSNTGGRVLSMLFVDGITSDEPRSTIVEEEKYHVRAVRKF